MEWYIFDDMNDFRQWKKNQYAMINKIFETSEYDLIEGTFYLDHCVQMNLHKWIKLISSIDK